MFYFGQYIFPEFFCISEKFLWEKEREKEKKKKEIS